MFLWPTRMRKLERSTRDEIGVQINHTPRHPLKHLFCAGVLEFQTESLPEEGAEGIKVKDLK